MIAEMWFFADDSNFGALPDSVKNRLYRYAMARTSAFSHTMFVIALEWEEGWSRASVRRSGRFIQAHNPWRRLLSVHSVGSSWWFSGESWASFIASQAGNKSRAYRVNPAAIALRMKEKIPHIGEEFGHLNGDSDARVRANLWANFVGGAAGAGTGSDLKALQGFLSKSRVPFQRMLPANHLVADGGYTRFLLAEVGRHYVVYSMGGEIKLAVAGTRLAGRWFNPRDPNAVFSEPFDVFPGVQNFSPPDDKAKDWVLWITDGSNLNRGIVRPSVGATMTRQHAGPKTLGSHNDDHRAKTSRLTMSSPWSGPPAGELSLGTSRENNIE
jgi:Putative collagen-binding domain of a collagenase